MNDFSVIKQSTSGCDKFPKTPLVSILIPVYNRENLVIEALESALSQDYPNFEVVISDNCSTDNTLNICINRCKDESRVTIIKQPKNIGPVPNWLAAGLACRGSLIKVLFSDDLLLDGCLTAMAPAMSRSVGFIYSSCLAGPSLSISTTLYRSKFSQTSKKTKIINSKIGLIRYIFNGIGPLSALPVSPGAAIFHRSHYITSLKNSLLAPVCLESIKTGAGPDLRLFLDALKTYPTFAKINKPLSYFRAHKGSFTVGDHKNLVNIGYAKTMNYFIKLQSKPWHYLLKARQLGQDIKSKLYSK